MPAVENILAEREQTYGNFRNLARIAVRLRRVISEELEARQKVLDPDMSEALAMICSKTARIINGEDGHMHVDSWRDIAGYATLVANRLEEGK